MTFDKIVIYFVYDEAVSHLYVTYKKIKSKMAHTEV